MGGSRGLGKGRQSLGEAQGGPAGPDGGSRGLGRVNGANLERRKKRRNKRRRRR